MHSASLRVCNPHRDERHLVPFEHVHDLREVDQRAAEAIHLIDHDAVDLARLDVRQQALESRAVHVAAGESAVVVAVAQADPALVLLAGDVCFARVALGVQRVELLLEALLRALAGVNRAPHPRKRRVHLLGLSGSCHPSWRPFVAFRGRCRRRGCRSSASR